MNGNLTLTKETVVEDGIKPLSYNTSIADFLALTSK